MLKKTDSHLNSVLFTTIMKGFGNQECFEEATSFFESIKQYTHLHNIIITYNCQLDILVRKGDMNEAEKLFKEIERVFGADLISYSTLIKGLCYNERKKEAFEYLKELMCSKQ